MEGGGWVERIGESWLFNSGRDWGEVPAHVILDLVSFIGYALIAPYTDWF